MNEELPLVEPVVRHGRAPQFLQSETFNVQTIVEQYEELARKHRSIALITKTTEEAKFIEKSLAEYLHVQRLEPNSSLQPNIQLLIVPSHLAKGLEFDAVIVCIVNEQYNATPIDQKLLYVAFTRAMHDLVLVGPTLESFLLQPNDL